MACASVDRERCGAHLPLIRGEAARANRQASLANTRDHVVPKWMEERAPAKLPGQTGRCRSAQCVACVVPLCRRGVCDCLDKSLQTMGYTMSDTVVCLLNNRQLTHWFILLFIHSACIYSAPTMPQAESQLVLFPKTVPASLQITLAVLVSHSHSPNRSHVPRRAALSRTVWALELDVSILTLTLLCRLREDMWLCSRVSPL